MEELDKCNFIKNSVQSLEERREQEIKVNASTFILNPAVKEINEQIKNFQKECPHSTIENGICIYCHKKIKED